MMSSEEETGDCFGLYGDKLLSKKSKRTRQRVDAGEPRNSYSSIPNFSSRPSFLSGGLYGAIFSSTQQQHFGLFAPGFAPAKMLNELLGRQVKQATDANNCSPDNMMTMDQASVDVPIKFECSTPIRRGGNLDDSATDSQELAAHHMLREILQGRKHEMMALEQELRNNQSENNNTLPNNNNINNNNNEIKSEDAEAAVAMQECLAEAGVGSQQQQELMEEALTGMESKSLPSPSVKMEEPGSPARPEDAKRARVENIVSGMRASPIPQTPTHVPQVNGCKKRKLYQPQQHDAGLGIASLSVDDDDDDEPEPLRQKRVEKDQLKSQLRTMQEQLAEMQQKYVQLCTRMEQESESQEVEEVTSDIEQDVADLKAPSRSPSVSPPSVREQACNSVPSGPPPAPPQILSQVSKMLSAQAKMHQVPPQHMMHAGPFNGMSGLMHQENGPHPGLSNAAAMYLGVSHKFFMEQEARLAKEAAERHHMQQQQQAQAAQQQQHQQQQEQQAQQVAAAQAAAAAAAAAQQNQQSTQTSQQSQTPNSHTSQQSPQSKELSERLQILRQPTITGSELEGLADVLKTEITASLTNLIDTIVSRFVHQRRFLGKTAETAAAEQLNKDLMLASQLLDRKSPRTKVTTSNQSSNTPQGPPNQPSQGPSSQPSPHTPISMAGPMPPRMNGATFPQQMSSLQLQHMAAQASSNQQNGPMGEHMRFQAPKPPPGMNSVAAAALYGLGPQHNPFCMPPDGRENPEQNEALSLVVTTKKKRHKVTDTRITPRTVSRILAQDGLGLGSPSGVSVENSRGPNDCPSPRPYHPPPPMLPVSLPTSVAIPNPGLHESQVFSPYSPFFTGPGGHHHAHHHMVSGPVGASTPGLGKLERDSPPLPHPTMLHPALLAAAQHGASPDYGNHMRSSSGGLKMDSMDQNSDCNSADISYDGMQPTISFSYQNNTW